VDPDESVVEMRVTAALVACLLVIGWTVACGESGSRARSGTSQSTSSATVIRLTRAHMFGDYDSDDGRGASSASDGDTDDRDKLRGTDNDSDGGHLRYDSDDSDIVHFGRAASPTARRAITALVKHYYAAAATDDGAKACPLIFSRLAKGLPETLGVGGPAYLRGSKTCAEVLRRLFARNAAQLAADAAQLEITGVRVAGKTALALLGFRTLPERQIEVIREGNVWKLYAPLDNELP
jgi:hypothetical protein